MKTKETKKLQDLVVFHEAESVNEARATIPTFSRPTNI